MGSSIMCWLWPLISGVLCGILGYILGKGAASRWKKKYDDLYVDFETYKKRNLQLENELKTCKENNGDIDISGFENKITDLESQLKVSNDKNTSLQNNLDNSKSAVLDESDWKEKVSLLQSNLMDTKNKFSGLESSVSDKDKRIAELEEQLKNVKTTSSISFDTDAAKSAYGKKIKQDDLKIIEGIGPKIEGLFHNFNIKTWKQLSETSIEKCQEVLNSGGDRYKIHKPGTWPKQAKLASEGKWKELVKWQDELKGGKA